MKHVYSIILIGFLFTSCIEEGKGEVIGIKSTFDSPFPKRFKNLTWKFGDEFSVKNENDTLVFKVLFDRDNSYNYIIQKQKNDTVFAGTVSKYRGMYYFNRKLNDSSYWISAVKIKNGIIRGFQTEWYQMKAWDSRFNDLFISSDKDKKCDSPILKYIDSEKKIIRLSPNKKAMRIFYESIIDSLPADTLINYLEPISDTELKSEEAITALKETYDQEYEIIRKFYPNPAVNDVTIVLNEEGVFLFRIYDNSGKKVKEGLLTKSTNIINVSELTSGIYFVKVYDSKREEGETVKFIKN